MYIIVCEIDHQTRLMHETGCSGLLHCDDPVGWDEEGGGREVHSGDQMYIHG